MVHIIAIVQGIVTGLVLLFLKRNGKHDSKYIALFLLLLSLAIINESYGDYSNVDYQLLYPFKFFLLLPNLIFLHINSKIVGANSRKRVFLNFIPGIIEFLTLSLLLLLIKSGWIEEESDFLFYFDEFYNYLTISYTIFIQIVILKKIRIYNKSLFEFQSTVHYKYLNWLKWVCFIIIFNEMYYTVYYFMTDELESDAKYYIIYAIIELALIFYLGIGALLQVNLKIEIPLPNSTLSEENNISETSNRSETDNVFQEVESFMSNREPFLNPDLNLKLLSQAMNISERQISNAINKNSGQNFYSYINQYRVEAVKIMLEENKQATFSIVGIGELAGFNSKSSFYTNFKKVTGSSPSQYIKEMS